MPLSQARWRLTGFLVVLSAAFAAFWFMKQSQVHVPSYLPVSEAGWVNMHLEDTVHYQLETKDATDEFAKLLPSGGHIVHMGSEQRPYTFSLFHQLLCLDIILKDYTARTGPSSLSKHCLNYLRQSILCLADVRLESVRSPFGPRVVSFSSDYVCRDWNVVYAAAESNYGQFQQL